MPESYSEVAGRQDVPVVLADHRSIITGINDSFVDHFGWSREEAVGQGLSILIPPAFRDAHYLGFARFISSGESAILGKRLDLPSLDKEGRQFNAEHYIVAELWEGRWRFAATILPKR